ncbi:hypothetical protein A2U01_0072423, partial [Trifolium medium]|nr:hypothetical protein [Trifolium medium]
NMLIRVGLSVISPERGRSLEPSGNGRPYNLFRERAAIVFLVAAAWKTAGRTVVVQGCRAVMPAVSPTSARGRALFSHEY